MAVQLSPQVIEWCQTEALGQVLVAWGNDDTRIPYAEVVQWLEDLGSDTTYGVDDDNGIMVWDAFEDNTGSWIADQIESLYKSYIACAEFAVKFNKPEDA
jgi:hypothetical protein